MSGKIFATVPPDGMHLHVFVGEFDAKACAAGDPAAFEPLYRGATLRGLRIKLATPPADRVEELIEESWRRKTPRPLSRS